MRKVLIGCAVALGLCVVVLVVAGIAVQSWVKSRFPDTEKIEAAQKLLVERYGRAEDFVPPIDAELPADRLATFVAVRESLAVRRVEAAASLSRFASDVKRKRAAEPSRTEKIGQAIGMASGGAAMVSSMMAYIGAREELLLSSAMGEGEYVYYYGITTLSWLGWDPQSDLEQQAKLEELGLHGDVSDAQRSFKRLFTRQLRNLRDELAALSDPTPEQKALLGTVREALDSGAADQVPIAGKLPAGWIASLEPYRTRLESSLPHTPAESMLDLVTLESRESGVFRWKKEHDERATQ